MYKVLSSNYYQDNEEGKEKKTLWKLSKYFLRRKERKQLYDCERYKNLPEDEKQKLVEYRKKYYKMRKNAFFNYKNIF